VEEEMPFPDPAAVVNLRVQLQIGLRAEDLRMGNRLFSAGITNGLAAACLLLDLAEEGFHCF